MEVRALQVWWYLSLFAVSWKLYDGNKAQRSVKIVGTSQAAAAHSDSAGGTEVGAMPPIQLQL